MKGKNNIRYFEKKDLRKSLGPVKREIESMLHVGDISTKGRAREMCDARFMFVGYVLTRKTSFRYNFTYASIGWFLNRDHATVLNAIKKHGELLDTDKKYKEIFEGISFRLDGILNQPHLDIYNDTISSLGQVLTRGEAKALVVWIINNKAAWLSNLSTDKKEHLESLVELNEYVKSRNEQKATA